MQVGVNLFGQFNSEIISGLFQRGGEAKQPGYPGDCGTLDDQLDDGYEKYDVEDDMGTGHISHHGIGGKDNGYCAT